ncbi:MAG: hypothetical protein PHO92_05480, partial [Candidatus Peribacteraceae bacterium]|nr:hypothetical protein [Candidatus Peribacteraceae bacterium]
MEYTHTTSRISALHSNGEARLIRRLPRAGGWKKEVRQLGKEYRELNQEREGKTPDQQKPLREQMNAKIEKARAALKEPMKKGMRLDAVRNPETKAMVLRAWAKNIQERAQKICRPPYSVSLEYVEGEGVVITPNAEAKDWNGDKKRIIACANLPKHQIQWEDRGESIVVQIRGYEPGRGYIGIEQAEQPSAENPLDAAEPKPAKRPKNKAAPKTAEPKVEGPILIDPRTGEPVREAPTAAPTVSPAVKDAINRGATVVGSGISEAAKHASRAPEKIVGAVSGLIDSLKGGDKSVEAAPEKTLDELTAATEGALATAKQLDEAWKTQGHEGGEGVNLANAIEAYEKYIGVANAELDAIYSRFAEEGRMRLETLPNDIADAERRFDELKSYLPAELAPAPEAAPEKTPGEKAGELVRQIQEGIKNHHFEGGPETDPTGPIALAMEQLNALLAEGVDQENIFVVIESAGPMEVRSGNTVQEWQLKLGADGTSVSLEKISEKEIPQPEAKEPEAAPEAAPEKTLDELTAATEGALATAKQLDETWKTQGHEGGEGVNLANAIEAYEKYIGVANAELNAIYSRFAEEGRMRLETLPNDIADAEKRLDELRPPEPAPAPAEVKEAAPEKVPVLSEVLKELVDNQDGRTLRMQLRPGS